MVGNKKEKAMTNTLDKLSDETTVRKVTEAEAALDDAIANPTKPKPKVVVSETPDYGATLYNKGKDARRTAIEPVRKESGKCEEPECNQPATVELRFHRHGSAANSASVYRGDFCEKHAHSVACLMARFGHRPIDGQERLWVRATPTWTAPPPKVKPGQKAAAAEVVAGAQEVKAEAEKGTSDGHAG